MSSQVRRFLVAGLLIASVLVFAPVRSEAVFTFGVHAFGLFHDPAAAVDSKSVGPLEPASLLLLGTALAVLAACARRSRRKPVLPSTELSGVRTPLEDSQ